ncbi:hypothetical protein Ddye_001555 [Dipteronia dyeriana]|uniref:Reverse transcriptase n=1 Tax=Dipteronia dyeriana TaxID=168575 RepID=A0AAE0CTL4_9ROSI|nr:hypothetical protein Ddye_001555 [Dipteronia dyeriana]
MDRVVGAIRNYKGKSNQVGLHDDITRLLKELRQESILIGPNSWGTERIPDFHPISLCNVVYKIMAKALANRLRLVLGEVIMETQSVCILGRHISDNALIGFECLHALRKRKDGSLALKLD